MNGDNKYNNVDKNDRDIEDRDILHCGTNDLCSDKSPEKIADDIIKLAMAIKNQNNTIIISHLVPRGDEYKGKAAQINTHLLLNCSNRNLPSISHDNIDPTRHLNKGKLHTNIAGTKIMTSNFINCIKGLTDIY